TELSGVKKSEAAIEQRERAMGRPYDLQVTYYDWNDPFPDFGERTIAAHGRTPVMAWYGPGKNRGDHRSLAEINNGHDDGWITRQAKAMKAFGKPIYLRLMPEMNGTWYHGFSGHPAQYIAAWRHIHELFDQVGVDNVIWVWCPNATPRNWDSYYPGDHYVDVIGVDAYNTTAGRPWRSFQVMFDPFLQHFAGRKPLMIGETATDSSGGSAATFISGMRRYLEHVAGPRYGVIAVCWFDTDTSDAHNWRVDQTPGAWQAWLALARDPYFGGHGAVGR
ncbi:MAG: glycoside hydrolase family 26 protein, partial [Sciscionella sp.]